MKIKINKGVVNICHDSQVVLMNLDCRKWVKISLEAFHIINEIIDMEYSEAVKKLIREYHIEKKNAEKFIDSLIDYELLAYNSKDSMQEINESKDNSIIGHCYLHVTKKCNLTCGYCSINANCSSDEDLTTNELKKLLRLLSVNKIHQLVLSGGEPIIRQDFEEITLYAEHLFPELGIVTNCTLLDDDKAKFIAQHYKKIQVSIDSGDEKIHDSIRGEGSFKKSIHGIQLLKKYHAENIKITPTINKINCDGIESIVKVAKELDVYLAPRFITPSGRGADDYDSYEISNEVIIDCYKKIWRKCKELGYRKYSIKQYFTEIMSPKNGCGVCRNKICVDVNGDIYPCAYMMSKDAKVGNVFQTQSIKRQINNSDFGKKLYGFDINKIENCKNCSVRYFCASGCIATNYKRTGTLCSGMYQCEIYKNLLQDLLWKTTDYSEEKLLEII